MNLVLYQFPECPYCQKVLKVIEELEINVQLKNTRTSSEDREELIALNGKTQVPCLVIDKKPMLESDDIVAWLRKNYAA